MTPFIHWLRDVRNSDVPLVGGKNASLGELMAHLRPEGIIVPEGFALSAQAYWHFLEANGIRAAIGDLMDQLDRRTLSNLAAISEQARDLVLAGKWPDDLATAVRLAHDELQRLDAGAVAVRSSATGCCVRLRPRLW